ncbi:MAG: glutamate racemase [Bacteroidales bacterium]|nr:glutamate racemase [Bacteroidales bacterium]
MSDSLSKKGAIGIFDSGYGGLTVLKEIVKLLPQYDYIYLGDNARAPYGTRSYETVYSYTLQAVEKLFELGCPLVILACNTASAKALRSIQQNDLPKLDNNNRVLGVIRPTGEMLPAVSQNGHIGVLATRGTVASNSYPLEIAKLHGEKAFTVSQLACPMWVPLVENNETDSAGADYFVKKYIDELFCIDPLIDTIILACTHYPLLEGVIRKFLPQGVQLIAQGAPVALSLQDYLNRHPEMRNRLSCNGELHYLTTEQCDHFVKLAETFMGRQVCAEHIEFLE